MNNNKIPASLRSDRVAGLVRNRWPLCFGTGGRNASESPADFIGIGKTVAKGRKELLNGEIAIDSIRRKGAGRKPIKKNS